MSTVQVRIDPQTKRTAALIFEKLGLDVSTAVKIYFAQVVRTQGIPFPLVTKNGFTPHEEKLLLKESKETRARHVNGKRRGHTKLKLLMQELSS